MRALVAMSGGVDSSVAAALMVEQGYDVIGVTLKLWEGPNGEAPTSGCCTVSDAEDARRVAAQLGIPYYVLDYTEDFQSGVVARFIDDYSTGRTPNPCVECNRSVKFFRLLEQAEEFNCDFLVTGHYARIRQDQNGWHLLRGIDESKDQSYVLYMLGQSELARLRFPVGEQTKAETRSHARRLGLRTADKADSQDICFVGNGDYRSFLRTHAPAAAAPGPVVDAAGKVLARHSGVIDFTIGQRKGLGVSVGEARYVVDIEPATSTVTLGRRQDLAARGLVIERATWTSAAPFAGSSIEVQVRYKSGPVEALVEPFGDDWRVDFEEPLLSIAPGQAAVCYRGNEVLGGGTIKRVLR